MKTHLKTLSGDPISRFCFGTMQFGGKADEDESAALYSACRAAGINFFDTAHVYNEGRSETLLGRSLAAERESVYVASKVNMAAGNGAENIRRSVEDSRSRMGTDFIDLYYLHRWDDTVPLEESFSTLAGEIEMGRIGAIGVSNFAAWQVMKAEAVARTFGVTIAMLQPMYNLVKRQVEVEILPMALSEGFAVAPYSPLGGGLLSGKYASGQTGRLTTDAMYSKRYGPEWMHAAARGLVDLAAEAGMHPATLAVAFAARHPGVTAPIISARSVDQLGPSLDAMDHSLADDLYARLRALAPEPPPATDRLEEA